MASTARWCHGNHLPLALGSIFFAYSIGGYLTLALLLGEGTGPICREVEP